MYVCMEWIVWITWWIIFCNRYSRLYWVYNQETYAVSENPLIMYVYIYIYIYYRKKIKTWYYPELLRPETMELLGDTRSKITKGKDGKCMSNLEITVGV